MYNKEKVKTLGLSFENFEGPDCNEKMGIPYETCRNTLNCRQCRLNHFDRVFEVISKEERFVCDLHCNSKRNKFGEGIDNFTCQVCHEKILEYIKEDFKGIFNKLSDENVR